MKLNIESLGGKFARMLAIFEQINQDMEGINDFGEKTGFCSENELLGEDAINQIAALCRRASYLKQRINLNKVKTNYDA